MISFAAFADEYAKIKVAQAELTGDTDKRGRMFRMAKALAQNIGVGGVTYGLGHGLGYAGAEAIRRSPLYLQKIGPAGLGKAKTIMGLLGAAGGVASLAAYNAGQRRVEEAAADRSGDYRDE